MNAGTRRNRSEVFLKIKVSAEKCTGCGLCENMCSLHHTGTIDRNRSAVKIHLDDLGESIHQPVVCRQCKVMKCLDSDMKKNPSLNTDDERKKFIWESEKRAELCPFGCCFAYRGLIYHCDLCGGAPLCVKVCKPGALMINE
jgi:carbon-monoxide dehydrogenase iron sulfur subunit